MIGLLEMNDGTVPDIAATGQTRDEDHRAAGAGDLHGEGFEFRTFSGAQKRAGMKYEQQPKQQQVTQQRRCFHVSGCAELHLVE
jgi:hypothetical protein